MENFLLILFLMIMFLYYFSTTNVYKSLYVKVNEEKNILEEEKNKYTQLMERYNKQVVAQDDALKHTENNLSVARNDLRDVKLQNNELRHQIDKLKKRSEELYAQVNTMI